MTFSECYLHWEFCFFFFFFQINFPPFELASAGFCSFPPKWLDMSRKTILGHPVFSPSGKFTVPCKISTLMSKWSSNIACSMDSFFCPLRPNWFVLSMIKEYSLLIQYHILFQLLISSTQLAILQFPQL